MKIGDMRHRITFQKPVETPDGYKGHTVKWQDVVTVWASVEPLTGREFFYAHQIKAEVTHRVKIRYREGITEKMRIKHLDRALAIESILDLKERHEVLEILCREEK
ncbi:MAG: phage head closure protein [Candidatus Hydrogenedentota bacterium]|nr:MAG: phage head closure protein [Candidatus Hydrogenedentota bacterium]